MGTIISNLSSREMQEGYQDRLARESNQREEAIRRKFKPTNSSSVRYGFSRRFVFFFVWYFFDESLIFPLSDHLPWRIISCTGSIRVHQELPRHSF